jgi:hypothetical protein
MLRLLFGLLLFASPILAQGPTSNPLAAAGCGANDVQFDVKTDKKQHPTAQPEAGKAIVYVISDTVSDHVDLHMGTTPTRFGVDGKWVGANGYVSYFFFALDPGDHRLCTNMQTKFQKLVKNSTAATSFTAEAGKIYYFRTKTPERPVTQEEVNLVPVDPAEGQVLVANAAFSTFHQKDQKK